MTGVDTRPRWPFSTRLFEPTLRASQRAPRRCAGDVRQGGHGSVSRRCGLVVLAGLAIALAGPALAAPRTVAVVSLIGDRLEVVIPQMTTGSHLDRNRRAALNDESGVFDRFTLRAAAQAIAAVDLGIGTVLISVPPSKLHDQPEQLFDGRHVALPAAIVDELERVGAQHLLLITKRRDDVRVPFVNERVGIGRVRGLGFYVDASQHVRLTETGDTAPGFLAPFAYFLLSLVDVRMGAVVQERKVTLMQTLSVAQYPKVTDPWDILDPAKKVELLQRLIRQGLAENMRQLLEGL